MKWEGNWCGRIHGDVEYIYVVWNGKSFSILSHEYSVVPKYKGMTPKAAIDFVEAENKRIEDDIAAMPRCKCGSISIVFMEEQHKNECVSCCQKRIKK